MFQSTQIGISDGELMLHSVSRPEVGSGSVNY